MKIDPLSLYQHLTGWRRWVVFGAVALVVVQLIVAAMSLLLHGAILPDHLLSGFVVTAAVAPASFALLRRLVDQLKEQQVGQMANSVQRAEETLRVALESSDEGILMVDPRGKVLATNRRFRELWQVPVELVEAGRDEALLEYVVNQLVDPEAFIQKVQSLYGSDDESHDTIAFNDGRQFSRFTRALSVGGEHGRIWCFRDISERRKAEQALASSERQWHTILENLDAYVYLKDTEGRYVYANRAVRTLWGVDEDAILGFGDEKFFDEGTVAQIRNNDQRVLHDGETVRTEETNTVIATGHKATYQSTKLSLRDDQGRIYALCGISIDITERKRMAQRLSMAIEVTRTVMWELDFATGNLSVDQNSLPLLGVDEGNRIDTITGWVAHIHPDDRDDFTNGVIAASSPGNPDFDFEYRLVDRAGKVSWVHTRGRVVQHNVDDKALLAVGTTMNITSRKLIEAAVLESEQRSRNLSSLLRLMCDNVPDMIWAKDLEKRFLFANRAICNELLHATSTEEPIGKNDLFFALREREAHSDNPHWHTFGELCQDSDVITLQNGCPSTFEEFGNIKGQHLVLEVHKAPFVNEQGQVIGTVGSARNITERKAMDDQLRLSVSVFTHANEGIMISDIDGNILDVNDAFTNITGYTRDEVIGKNPRILNSGRQDAAFFEAMWRDLLARGRWVGEVWNRRKDGEVFAAMETISVVPDGNGRPGQYVALFSDITAIKEHERQLERIAHYDALTALPNRILLADRLRHAMAQAERRREPLAVVYLDLDGFKAVNDRYGHDVGDRLLMIVASRMKHSLREGDTLARLGGDEFVAVLLDIADLNACAPMLDRLLEAVAEPAEVGEQVLRISASLGVTFYPQEEDADADLLLRQADQAMYQAKLSGKNRHHVFDADHDRSVRGHHETLRRLRTALTSNEFVLYYQPKVNMRSGAIVGVEALIRWQHPESGLLGPGQFLPVVEDHVLSLDIGEWVIETALIAVEAWQAAGLDIPVSVNISAYHLQQSDFVPRLRAILSRHPSVAPSKLSLEVLETSAVRDLLHVSALIKSCRELGVTFALDDFGTGYSSLTYLKNLPVTEIKTDQSFIRHMLHDPNDLAIVEGVLSFAKAFHRQIIAEGVESVEHGSMLLQLGCDLAQGYVIARPMPATELSAWSQQWKPDPRWQARRAVSPPDLPALYASVEHSAWIEALEQHLNGTREVPPPPGHEHRRFDNWLDKDGRERYSNEAHFQVLERNHQKLHELAEQISALDEAGDRGSARSKLDSLKALWHQSIDELHDMLDTEAATGD